MSWFQSLLARFTRNNDDIEDSETLIELDDLELHYEDNDSFLEVDEYIKSSVDG